MDDRANDANVDAEGGRVVGFSWRFAAVAAPFALAAAMLVYVVAGRSGDDGRALLPDYAIAASGDPTMRGAAEPTSARLTLRGGAEGSFEIVARPTTTAGAKVVAYAFATIGEGEPNAVDAKIEIAPEGSVRIRGRARALQGAREVRIVIGTASDFARYDDALARARNGKSDAHVRVLVVPITRD